MERTTYFGLKKPWQDEEFDVDTWNENLDMIDAELHKSSVGAGHEAKEIYGEEGVHGIRYWEDKLQIKGADGSWEDVESGGGIAPSNVTDLRIKVGNEKLTLFWSDPGDIIVEGQSICVWKGTKLVMKAGAYPENVKDGTLILDNQILDNYKENGFVVNNLNNGTTYYFALFPYSDTGATNISESNRISGTPQPYKKMTVRIDLSNSNPATCSTYADDAVGMTAGSSEWDDFFGHYPVLFKDGAEVGKLDPNDFTKFEDGTDADITSGDAGDIMICFPRHGLAISTTDNIVTVSMTDDPDNDDFKYYAHSRGDNRRDVFYLGAYKGYLLDSKLRSLSGKSPRVNATIGNFRTYAQANGSGYEMTGFYQITYLQAMYLLKYKSLDSQTAVGMGYVSGSNAIATGGTEAWGMDCELVKQTNPTYMTDSKHHVKVFGLEDLWGNVHEFVDGIYSSSARNIITATDNFNDTGTGYTDNGQGATSNLSGYMSKPQGTTEKGFIAKANDGSSTTYFCDYAYLYSSAVAFFGGTYGNGAYAGVFWLGVSSSASYSGSYVGARLMYL